MAWEVGQRYRGRAVQGQAQIEKNVNGTTSALILLEVSMGPNAGQRLRFRGYLNSAANAEKTVEEMRAMGWRAPRLGSWDGLGTKECEFSCMADIGDDGKTYYRAAFVRPIATVNPERAVDETGLEALNAQLGSILAKPSNGASPGPVPAPASGEGGEIPF